MTEKKFTAIAKEHLRIETLETRRSDSLDFHDVSVWGVRDALEAAYKAGANAERRAFRRSTVTVLQTFIETAGDLYAAIHGVTDQFDDQLGALTKASDAAVKLANRLRRAS
jgi:ABC-type transporter Mla subunit MlaD